MPAFRIAALAAAAVLWAGAASAHAFHKTSSPPVGGTVAHAPAQVVITFTEGVEPMFSSISVRNAHGVREDAGKPHHVGGDTRLAVKVRPLPPGTYTVVWHATATDTHKTQGSFKFTVSGG